MLDWNDIPYFIAVAETRTLAGAAKKLSVNHSTVYRRINTLEEKLGVRLFDRFQNGYLLTHEGESILEHAYDADNSIQRFGRTVAGKDFQLSGRILITVPSSSLAPKILAPCVALFIKEQPDIQIDILVSDEDKDLSRREADLALRATRNPPDYLIGRKVCDIEWCIYASKDYLKEHGRPKSMDDLENHKLIGVNGSLAHVDAYNWFNNRYPSKNFLCKASELKTISSLSTQGLGVVLLPSDFYEHSLENLFPITPDFSEKLWMLIHPDLRNVARINVFSEFFYEYVKNHNFINNN